MKSKVALLTVLSLSIVSLLATDVSWSLKKGSGTSNPANYDLKSFATPDVSEVALMDSKYRPEWDICGQYWVLNGSFCAKEASTGTQYLVGTRSGLGAYTGWALQFRDGKLQLMIIEKGSAGKSAQSSKRYDDGKEHNFELKYTPEGVVLNIDGEKVFGISGALNISEDTRRRFVIGSLYEGGKAKLPFTGELKNFSFRELKGMAPANVADASKLDPELKVAETPKDSSGYQDIMTISPDIIQGRGWDKISGYQRLPDKFKDKVRSPVWQLSNQSAGICLMFKVDKPTSLGVRWTLTSNNYLPHMAPIGVNGLDYYYKENGKWYWGGTARPSRMDAENILERYFSARPNVEYMIYLPLYSGMRKFELKVAPGVNIIPIKPSAKPLVFYGTSITHGCSASRPGMAYPAIIGRRLDLPVINLGFSGNGTTDGEFVEVMGEIAASAYIIDCLPNMTGMDSSEVIKRTDYFVRNLRKLAPNTPIILVEDRQYAYSRKSQPHWDSYRALADKLRSDGITGLYYVKGDNLLGSDGEATIDGSHPTDLGMMRYADEIEPVIKEALKGNKK